MDFELMTTIDQNLFLDFESAFPYAFELQKSCSSGFFLDPQHKNTFSQNDNVPPPEKKIASSSSTFIYVKSGSCGISNYETSTI